MLKIFTDGSSRGNPGPGGYGIVMIYKNKRKEISQGYKLTTNNRMELTAVIKALESVKNEKIKIKIFSDSKYVVESIEKGWIWNWEKKGFKKILSFIRKQQIVLLDGVTGSGKTELYLQSIEQSLKKNKKFSKIHQNQAPTSPKSIQKATRKQ